MAIDRLSGSPLTSPGPKPSPGAGASDQPGFGDALQSLVQAVDGTTGEANAAVGRMLEGTGDVHEAMIALQRADVALQLTVQVRNKLVQAYQDIMRMPV